MWLGGWYNNYRFVGDIDEVRISKVARSADWIKLEYENQKPLQTLVGTAGAARQRVRGFAGEDRRSTRARARRSPPRPAAPKSSIGSQTRRHGDRCRRGPVSRTRSMPAAWRATRRSRCSSRPSIADEVKTLDIPVTIKETIPDPVFTLRSAGDLGWPRHDRGRAGDRAIWRRCRRKARANCITRWTVSGGAVIKADRARQADPQAVAIQRDDPVTAARRQRRRRSRWPWSIAVTEPKIDAWVDATAGKGREARGRPVLRPRRQERRHALLQRHARPSQPTPCS